MGCIRACLLLILSVSPAFGVRALQRHLVEIGNLPKEVLTHRDSFPLPDKPKEKRRRLGALREIVLARALYRCGDWEGLGEQILNEYRRGVRGLFARHGGAVHSAGN